MNVHKNAPLTPKGREAMVRSVVEGGLSKADAAYQFNTTPKTVAKWVKRFRAEGVDGLRDRSSRPHSSPSQTPQAACAAIEAWHSLSHRCRFIKTLPSRGTVLDVGAGDGTLQVYRQWPNPKRADLKMTKITANTVKNAVLKLLICDWTR